jgi:hypothetical protein
MLSIQIADTILIITNEKNIKVRVQEDNVDELISIHHSSIIAA